MSDDDVSVEKWPDQPLSASHSVDQEQPTDLSVSFEGGAASVLVRSGDPAVVDMPMTLGSEGPIPLAFSLCCPVEVTSSYTIDVEIFDRRLATIEVHGTTMLETKE